LDDGLTNLFVDDGLFNNPLVDVLDLLHVRGCSNLAIDDGLDLFDDVRANGLLDDCGLHNGAVLRLSNHLRGLLLLHQRSGSASDHILALLGGENALLNLSWEHRLLVDGLGDLVNLGGIDFTVNNGLNLLGVNGLDDLFHSGLMEEGLFSLVDQVTLSSGACEVGVL